MAEKYIFINPVVLKLYDISYLKNLLTQNNFKLIFPKEDIAQIIKNKYLSLSSNSKECIIDSRCPKIKDFIENYTFSANINPILIETALHLHAQKQKEDFLYITTPCIALENFGNNLNLSNTLFITWNNFVSKFKLKIDLKNKKQLQNSPIPPGFFKDLEGSIGKIPSVSGKQNIIKIFKEKSYKKHKLIEMLYCDNGCHNGDGI